MSRKRKLPPGMTIRGEIYYACFRAEGRLVRKKLSSDFDSARRILNELRARADRADFGLMDNDEMLDSIRAGWERQCRLTLAPATVRRYRQNLDSILSGIPVKKVNQLSAGIINAYREVRLTKAAPRTVNMEVTALSTMLNWAVSQKRIGSNPLAAIKALPTKGKEAKRRRSLTAAEVGQILEMSPAYLRPVWRLFFTAGVRKNELASMRFDDVDFERGTVVIRASVAKNRKSREIPLDAEMLATIIQLRDDAPSRRPGKGSTPAATARIEAAFSKDHVFVTKASTPWKNNLLTRFYAICKKAGVEGAVPRGSIDSHAARGSFATLAIDNGASPKAVQEMLGHATLELTMNAYAKATDRAKRDAVSALPFAAAVQPQHVLTIEGAHKARAASGDAAKVVTA